MTIGRDAGCSVQVDDVGLSRVHARVVLFGGQCALCDLGSRNGIVINDTRLQSGEISPLRQGDVIRMGAHTTLRLSLVDEAEEQGLKQAYEASVRDWLTDLYNRRFFRKLLSREWECFQRNGQHLCVALLDLDHFKRVNDTLGHAAGDDVLRGVAGALQGGVRGYDAVARHGGEEFAVLFRGAELRTAELATARLVAAISRLRIAHEGAQIQITASAGVACSSELGTSAQVEQLVDAADERLFAAKRAGRNQVVCG